MPRWSLVFCIPLIAVSVSAVEAQQVFTDRATFLAAVGEVVVQGFESFPTHECSTGGPEPATVLVSESFTVETQALDGGSAFLCTGTTAPGGPIPTEGQNTLVAGSVTFDRYQLTFSFPRNPIYAVAFYLTDAAEQGSVVLTDKHHQIEVASCCLSSGSVLFFGFISDKPIKSFSLTSTGIGDGLGIDEVMLAFVGRPLLKH